MDENHGDEMNALQLGERVFLNILFSLVWIFAVLILGMQFYGLASLHPTTTEIVQLSVWINNPIMSLREYISNYNLMETLGFRYDPVVVFRLFDSVGYIALCTLIFCYVRGKYNRNFPALIAIVVIVTSMFGMIRSERPLLSSWLVLALIAPIISIDVIIQQKSKKIVARLVNPFVLINALTVVPAAIVLVRIANASITLYSLEDRVLSVLQCLLHSLPWSLLVLVSLKFTQTAFTDKRWIVIQLLALGTSYCFPTIAIASSLISVIGHAIVLSELLKEHSFNAMAPKELSGSSMQLSWLLLICISAILFWSVYRIGENYRYMERTQVIFTVALLAIVFTLYFVPERYRLVTSFCSWLILIFAAQLIMVHAYWPEWNQLHSKRAIANAIANGIPETDKPVLSNVSDPQFQYYLGSKIQAVRNHLENADHDEHLAEDIENSYVLVFPEEGEQISISSNYRLERKWESTSGKFIELFRNRVQTRLATKRIEKIQ